MQTDTSNARFTQFLSSFDQTIDQANGDEAVILTEGGKLLYNLISSDDWLPTFCSQPHPSYYQQYLLYCDPQERYSVLSFVWGPGQSTPIHDHTVWGLIGMLRGSETAISYNRDSNGKLEVDREIRLEPGDVDRVSPKVGDIHRVANTFNDEVSISIHIYGANIGKVKRHVYPAINEAPKDFISGYANNVIPNFWST